MRDAGGAERIRRKSVSGSAPHTPSPSASTPTALVHREFYGGAALGSRLIASGRARPLHDVRTSV